MNAYVVTKYTKDYSGLSLRELPETPLSGRQVRVRLQAAGLNPVDAKTAQGEPRMLLPFKPPFVLGVDFAGVVSEIGSGVQDLRPGDAVFGYAGMDQMGAFAESVTIDADRVAVRPASLRHQEAGCLPLPFLCSVQALDAGGVGPGKRVLIHGGAGGVGSIAVQIAARRGAEVYATASGGDAERVRGFGAAHVIDYRTQKFEDVARNMDVVFDTLGGETLKRSWSCVAPGGTVASLHVPPSADTLVAAGLRAPLFLRALLPLVTRSAYSDARRANARLAPVLTTASGLVLGQMSQWFPDEPPRVHIDREFSFDALEQAIKHMTSGKARGRVVLTHE